MDLQTAIEGFYIYLSSNNYSPITASNYKRFMQIFCKAINNPQVDSISRENITDFFQELRDTGRSESTIQAYWRTIRTFYNWASDVLSIGGVDDIPMPRAETRAIIPFTKDETSRLIKSCKTKRDKAIILFLLDTGLRIGEATRMTVGDVDINEGKAIVRPFHNSTKSRPREVRFGRITKNALWEYISSRNDLINKSAPLLATNEGRFLDRYQARNILRRIAARAEIPNVHPHRFRHTFAIEFLRNGGNIFTLQELLGHSSLVMVRHYLKISQADIAEAHRKSSPVDNWRI
jgi:integrase/recombinase XerD